MWYINRYIGKHFTFHFNLNIPHNVLFNFPSYYKDMIQCWIKYSSHPPTKPSAIASQYLWFNSDIKVHKTVVFYKEFSENQLNFLTDFFDLFGKLKSCSDLAKEYNVNHKLLFKCCQLIHTFAECSATDKIWKRFIHYF